jgi:hypothetical protein
VVDVDQVSLDAKAQQSVRWAAKSCWSVEHRAYPTSGALMAQVQAMGSVVSQDAVGSGVGQHPTT